MDLATFRTLFPEFTNAPDVFVSAWLAETLPEIDPTIWGTDADSGHGLLTAHRMAVSPFGRNSRLSSEKGESTYGKQFAELETKRAVGIRCL